MILTDLINGLGEIPFSSKLEVVATTPHTTYIFEITGITEHANCIVLNLKEIENAKFTTGSEDGYTYLMRSTHGNAGGKVT